MNRDEALIVISDVKSLCVVLDCLSAYNADTDRGAEADAWEYATNQLYGNFNAFRDALCVLGLGKNDRLVGVHRDLEAFAFSGAPMCFHDAWRALDAVWVLYSFDLDRNTINGGEERV